MARGLRKRGKFWYAIYSDGTGKMKEESTKCSNKRDALLFLEERHRQVREGKLPFAKRIPNYAFKDFANDYLEWSKGNKDYRNKKSIVPKLIDEFGKIPLQKFNTLIIEKYQSKLKETLKPASVNRILAVLKHIFSKARDWEMIGEHTHMQIRKVKLFNVDNKRIRYLNEDECKRLIEACNEHLKPIVETSINTGMRKGEILQLKWQNVDLFGGNIQVEDSKNNESRQIPMNETMRQLFRELPRRLDIDYVFFNHFTGKPYNDLKKAFRSACKRAKINNFTFHDLRHTFASHLVMRGVYLSTVKAYLGHKTIRMTERYAQLSPEHKTVSIGKLNGVTRGWQKLGKIEGNENAKVP